MSFARFHAETIKHNFIILRLRNFQQGFMLHNVGLRTMDQLQD